MKILCCKTLRFPVNNDKTDIAILGLIDGRILNIILVPGQ